MSTSFIQITKTGLKEELKELGIRHKDREKVCLKFKELIDDTHLALLKASIQMSKCIKNKNLNSFDSAQEPSAKQRT